MINVSCLMTQRSDAGEARTRDPSVKHCAAELLHSLKNGVGLICDLTARSIFPMVYSNEFTIKAASEHCFLPVQLKTDTVSTCIFTS